MNATADFVLSKEILDKAHFTAEELAVEIATHLYATKRLASLDLISFQRELAKRDISIHYDVKDLHLDMRNLGLELRK